MSLDYVLTIFCDDMTADPQGWPCTLEGFKELYADHKVEGLDTLTEEQFREHVRRLGFGELLA